MRILLTTHQFFPQFAAGTEVLTYSVARELIKRGHIVQILTGYPAKKNLVDKERYDEYNFDEIHVYRFHHAYAPMGVQTSLIEVGYDNRLGADYFERILEIFQPDVVHFFHMNRLGSGLIDRAVQVDIPRFMTPTDFWMICPTGQLLLPNGSLCSGPSADSGNCLKHLIQNTQNGLVNKATQWLPTRGADLLVRLTQVGALPNYPKKAEVIAISNRLSVNISRLNKLDGLVVPNEFMKNMLIQHEITPDLITVADFGVDVLPPEFNKPRTTIFNPLRIGFIGTLAPHKGCHVLIEALLTIKNKNIELKIYGKLDDFPDYINKLKYQAKNLISIEFCGTFPNSEIGKILSNIDALVIPSLWYENTPLVLHSAQAAHCPVIASNLPGLSEVIEHDKNGLLFETGKSSDLARQILRLINEDKLLINLSTNARQPKSTKKYVDELLTLWQKINI